MKKISLFFTAILTFGSLWADTLSIDGIFATYSGSTITYKLSSMPRVSYTIMQDGTKTALITLSGQSTPVAQIPLKNGATLKITYATYIPEGIGSVASDKVTIIEKCGKKYIKGGRLIFIGTDGKMYNANGTEIKD